MKQRLSRIFAGVLALLILNTASPSLANIQLDMKMEEAGDSFVEYPQLAGMDNAFVRDAVNTAMKSAVEQHLNTLGILQAGTAGSLQVSSQAMIWPSSDGHDLLTVLLTAHGRMPNGRLGFQQIPLQFDLANAQPVGPEAVFTNPPDAKAWIENYLQEEFADALSNYLDLDAITPFPLERLLITKTGITFFYLENTLTWLSGRSASIHFLFHELENSLNMQEGSYLDNLGIPDLLAVSNETAQQIMDTVVQGSLTGLDASLGDLLVEVIERNKLQYDPEGFPDGEKYQLEDDRYRGTVLISRDSEQVYGMLSSRINLYGLITGRTKKEEAVEVLGQPVASIPMDFAAAGLYGFPEGTLDSYLFGQNELRLYYTQEEILHSIWLQQTK